MRTTTFMKRTYSIFTHQRKRARKSESEQHLDYDLEGLRIEVEANLPQGCFYCLQPITEETFSCDHGHPVSRGGSFALANIYVCCRPCNEAKGNMTVEEFQTVYEALRRMPDQVRKDVIKRLRAGGKVFGRM